MGLKEALRGRRVYFDTMVFIYLLEGFDALRIQLGDIRDCIAQGETDIVTSELTLCETLVQPFRAGKAESVAAYRIFIEDSGAFALQPVRRETFVRASLFRAQFGLRTPDAIHVATAVETGCTAFVTNDAAIRAPRDLRIVMLRDA